jgi:hypothetical protein
VDEVAIDTGAEDDLIDALEAKGYRGDECAVIADASGEWQDAARTKGRGSWDMLRRRRWHHLYKPDSMAERNPRVEERCATANARIRTADDRRHFFVVPELRQLAQALSRWPLNSVGTPSRHSEYAHRCDGATYPLCRFYPRRLIEARLEFTRIERGRSERAEAMKDW